MGDTNNIKQAVILAGGLGTRLFPLTKEMPKPMIAFYGKPFLAYLIEKVVEQGIEEILILTGYKAEAIEEYFGDGSNFGVAISYSRTPVEDNTGTRIRKAFKHLKEEFLLLYCDNYWPLNLAKMLAQFRASENEAQVVIYNNTDAYTKSNIIVKNQQVEIYDKKRETAGLEGVDIGFLIIKKSAILDMPEEDFLFETYLFPKLIKRGKLGAYVTGHRYYSVGSFARLELTRKFLQQQKYILVDRDGVLNEKAPKADYVKSWSEWKWKAGAIGGLKYIASKGYKIVLITNQAGIAREKMTDNDLHSIHFNMKEDLAKEGVSIEEIYFCPHGWDEGCSCRKPKPGMLWQAQRDFHIDLSNTYFVGDDVRDLEAAEAAGCKGLLINDQETLEQVLKNCSDL